jgi:hypothetical protein
VSVDFQILDLTDEETRSHLNVDEADLVSDDYATTQAIAAAARNAGFDAVLAPAAAATTVAAAASPCSLDKAPSIAETETRGTGDRHGLAQPWLSEPRSDRGSLRLVI